MKVYKDGIIFIIFVLWKYTNTLEKIQGKYFILE